MTSIFKNEITGSSTPTSHAKTKGSSCDPGLGLCMFGCSLLGLGKARMTRREWDARFRSTRERQNRNDAERGSGKLGERVSPISDGDLFKRENCLLIGFDDEVGGFFFFFFSSSSSPTGGRSVRLRRGGSRLEGADFDAMWCGTKKLATRKSRTFFLEGTRAMESAVAKEKKTL